MSHPCGRSEESAAGSYPAHCEVPGCETPWDWEVPIGVTLYGGFPSPYRLDTYVCDAHYCEMLNGRLGRPRLGD